MLETAGVSADRGARIGVGKQEEIIAAGLRQA